jgi:hypothetical protein
MLTANSLLNLLVPWHNRHLVDQLGGQLARECRGDLWQRGQRCLGSMTIAAVRGYARARASGCMAAKADQMLTERHLKSTLRARVIDAAVEQLVGMVVHDVLTGQLPADERSMAA